tara:strand:+ start:1066 stop:1251 length:186 start_codon:yes stop_codon:yes gene_type:complete
LNEIYQSGAFIDIDLARYYGKNWVKLTEVPGFADHPIDSVKNELSRAGKQTPMRNTSIRLL